MNARFIPIVLIVTSCVVAPSVASRLHAQPRASDMTARRWALSSGGVTWRLAERRGQLVTDYLGPTAARDGGAAAWDSVSGRYPSREMADFADRGTDSLPMRITRVDSSSTGARRELLVTLRHASRPLEVLARYTAWGETGVFTRRLTIRNRARTPLTLDSRDALLALDLPTGEWTMRTLWGGWGQERQLAVERVGHGARRFEQAYGRSSRGLVPWLSLRDEARGVEYLADLAWSGNWWMEVERHPDFNSENLWDRPLSVRIGLHHDVGGAITIAAGDSLALPP